MLNMLWHTAIALLNYYAVYLNYQKFDAWLVLNVFFALLFTAVLANDIQDE